MALPARLEQHAPAGRGRLHPVDGGVRRQQRQHPQRILVVLAVRHRQPAPAPERPQHLQQGDVEGRGGDEEPVAAGRQSEPLADPVEEAEQGPPADDHPLGLTGGARGEHHVGRQGIVHLGVGGPRATLALPQGRQGSQRTAKRGHPQHDVADHRREPGLTGDALQPLHREVRLERHEAEAEPQTGEQAGHQIRAARQVEADPLPHRQPLQAGGYLIDPQVQPGVGQPVAVHADGGRQRRGAQQVRQAGAQPPRLPGIERGDPRRL
ncbi:hypothetical protein D3C79_590080 [compost metagenome]